MYGSNYKLRKFLPKFPISLLNTYKIDKKKLQNNSYEIIKNLLIKFVGYRPFWYLQYLTLTNKEVLSEI